MFDYSGVNTYTKNSKALAQLAPIGQPKNLGKISKDEIKEMMTPN